MGCIKLLNRHYDVIFNPIESFPFLPNRPSLVSRLCQWTDGITLSIWSVCTGTDEVLAGWANRRPALAALATSIHASAGSRDLMAGNEPTKRRNGPAISAH